MNKTKKRMETPELETLRFDSADLITTSIGSMGAMPNDPNLPTDGQYVTYQGFNDPMQ